MTVREGFQKIIPVSEGFERGGCRPLFEVANAFDEISDFINQSKNQSGLLVSAFANAASFICPLFSCLGSVFKFAETDFSSKVQDFLEASKKFESLSSLLEYDIENDSVRKAGSRSRNLLRIKQGIEMFKVLLEEILSTEGDCLREPASIAYSKVLAPSHSWAVRKAVSVGLYVVPTKTQLLKKLNEDEYSFKIHAWRFIASSTLIVQYVEHLFLEKRLGIDW